MLTIEVNRNTAGAIISAYVLTEAEVKAAYGAGGFPDKYENRNDWKTYEQAAEVAAALGPKYQAIDNGAHVSPRYDVIDLPQVGQEVSYAFNGDSYPCGKIISISKGPGFRKIVAAEVGDNGDVFEHVFYRRCRDGKPTGGAWIMDGTWSLVQGHVSKRNPEF
jgi:hypothetical protein